MGQNFAEQMIITFHSRFISVESAQSDRAKRGKSLERARAEITAAYFRPVYARPWRVITNRGPRVVSKLWHRIFPRGAFASCYPLNLVGYAVTCCCRVRPKKGHVPRTSGSLGTLISPNVNYANHFGFWYIGSGDVSVLDRFGEFGFGAWHCEKCVAHYDLWLLTFVALRAGITFEDFEFVNWNWEEWGWIFENVSFGIETVRKYFSMTELQISM